MSTWIKQRWDKGKMISGLKPAVFLTIVSCFMLFIFAPLEIYLGNQNEFWYDSYMLMPFLIKDFLIASAVSLCGFIAAYLLGNFFYTAAVYCYFTCFIACYIQGNYLVSGLPPFDGTDVNWDMYRSETIWDVIIWLVIAIVILAVLLILKSRKFLTLVFCASIFFFLMLGSTLTVLGVNGGLLKQKQFVKFTKNDQFEMSSDTNFIILLLDAIDEACFWEIWERHPEYEEAMADFTFYNNAMSGYAYTDHSLPLMISGEWFENEEPYEDYIDRIYRDSPFFNFLEEQGYSLSFYDDEIQFETGVMDGEFANMTYAKSTLLDPQLFNTRIIKMTGVKYAPYFMKPYNAMSGYAYTDHSLPLMISGEWFENEEPYEDYIDRIYRDSPFFNFLEEQGYSLSFYDDEIQFETGVMDGEFANMTYAKSTLLDPQLFNTRIIKMTGVKYAPYFMKPYCWFDPNKLNHQQLGSKDAELFVWNNGAFYDDVKKESITCVDEKRFKLIHLMGAHVPFRYDQYVNEIEDADYFTCIESSMTVTMAYLDKLREAGVYDNSIIFVLSDHGYNISGDAVRIPQRDENQNGRQHPILFVKGLNESHDLKISGAPISYEDLVEAYYKLLEGNLSDDCFEYQEGDYRERRYLLYKYLGEDHMVEYIQTGYAGDEETLIPTGRVFDAK